MSRRKAILRTALLSGMLTWGARADPGDFIDVFIQPGSGGLYHPRSLAFGDDGNLYVCGMTPFLECCNIVRYDGATGDFLDVFTSGFDIGILNGVTFGPDGHLYVCAGSVVVRYNGLTGAFIDLFVPGDDRLHFAWHMTFGPDENLYVSSTDNDLVARFDGTSGEFIDVFASGDELDWPKGLTFGPDGDLYVCSYGTDSVVRYDGTTGAFLEVFATGPALHECRSLRFGPDGHLYVANDYNVLWYRRVTGEFMGVFSTGLYYPQDLTFGPDGNLYVADIRPGYPVDNDVVFRFEGPHPVIPALSEWGLAVTGLLVLVAGTLLLARRRAAAA